VETSWFYNLPEKKLERAEVSPECGFYMFLPHPTFDYIVVYYKKFHKRSTWILNLFRIDYRAIFPQLVMMLNVRRFSRVVLKENEHNKFLNGEPYEAVELIDGEHKVELIVGSGQAKQLMLRMLETEPLQRAKLSLCLDHSSITEDHLLELLKKGIRLERLSLSFCKNLSDKAVRMVCNSAQSADLV
jgi:hypothetical protein